MREVCVVGVGMTKFGKYLDKEPRWLAEEAVYKAVTDAGISHKDVEVAYVGNVGAGATGIYDSRRGRSCAHRHGRHTDNHREQRMRQRERSLSRGGDGGCQRLS